MQFSWDYSNCYNQFPEHSNETNPTLSSIRYTNYHNELNTFFNELYPDEEHGQIAFTQPESIPLPGELTNLFKPFECELCNVSVSNELSAFTHYEGKTHIKNVNAFMKEHYKIEGSLKIRKERFVPVVCELCNIELTSNVIYQQHFNGRQHIKNLMRSQYLQDTFQTQECGLPPTPTPPKLGNFICNICNVGTNTESQMIIHKNGKKHRKRLNMLQKSNLDNAINDFYNGEWPEGAETGYINQNNVCEKNDQNERDFIVDPNMDYPLEFNNNVLPENYETLQLIESQVEDKEKEDQLAQITVDILPSQQKEKREEQLTLVIHDNEDKQSSMTHKEINECIAELDCQKNNSVQSQNEVFESKYISNENFGLLPKSELSINVNKSSNEDKNNENCKNNVAITSYLCDQETISADGNKNNKTQSTEEKKIKEETVDHQELTKLAIEEIVKESCAFKKERNNEISHSCEYDFAGFRIKDKYSKNKGNNENLTTAKTYLQPNKFGNNRYTKSVSRNNKFTNYFKNYRNCGYNSAYNYRSNYNLSRYQTGYYGYQKNRYNKYENSNYKRIIVQQYNRKRKRSSSKSSCESDRSRDCDKDNKNKRYLGRDYHSKSNYYSRYKSHYSTSYKESSKRKKYRSGYTSDETTSSSVGSCCFRRSCSLNKHCRSNSCSSSRNSCSSSSSSSNSSSDSDYRLDKDGYCEKRHRSETAQSSCPYKHKTS